MRAEEKCSMTVRYLFILVNKENLKISYEIEDILDQLKQAEQQRQKGLFITSGGETSFQKPN